jgi:hypothetical protein
MMRGNAILSKVESIAQGSSFADEVDKSETAETAYVIRDTV